MRFFGHRRRPAGPAGVAVVLMAVVALLASACTPREAAPGTPPAAEPATLVMGRGADSDNLDPARTTSGESAKVIDNLFDTLVEFKPGTTEILPGLAEDWDVSPDGLVWTFHLRRGVEFHDGTPVDAEAVKFNFERQIDPNHPYHTDDMEYFEYLSYDWVLEKVEAVDAHTVRFTLTEPHAPFLTNLAVFASAIASPTAIMAKGEAFGREPVGSGPFKFVSWVKDSEIVLEANKDHPWAAPRVDRLVFKVIPDNAVRLAELEAGSIHIMDGVDPNDLGRVQANANLVLYELPGLNINYMAFPVLHGPWQKQEVRQAANYAINRDELVKHLYKGAAVAAKGPLPPSILDHPQLTGYEYNPEKARQLLAQAGYAGGFTTALFAYPNPRAYNPVGGARLAEAIQPYLEAVGIKVGEIRTMDWTSYLQETKKGTLEIPYFLGWMGDNGDPDNFLYPLLFSTNTRNKYGNPDADALMLEGQREADPARRAEIYRQAQRILVEDAPWVFISHGVDLVAARKELKGFKQHPLQIFRFADVALEGR